jgi:hypothetical protein
MIATGHEALSWSSWLTPTWFPHRANSYEVALVADGCRIPAHAWEQSHDTLQLLIDDPSGLLMGRLFVAQLVQAVSGRRRILGTIRHVYTRSSEARQVSWHVPGRR